MKSLQAPTSQRKHKKEMATGEHAGECSDDENIPVGDYHEDPGDLVLYKGRSLAGWNESDNDRVF